MKQYTTTEQTAKLMELGFEKPKSISGYYQRGPYEYDAETNTKMVVYDDTQYPIYAYSIGELIEFCPRVISNEKFDYAPINIFHDAINWVVGYDDGVMRFITSDIELIDALCVLCRKLKVEGVI